MSHVETEGGPLFLSGDDDSEMSQAEAAARAAFRYFWREVSWERRRIVPALDMQAVKIAFEGPPKRGLLSRILGKRPESEVRVEHMWVGKIDFDGDSVSGVLLNSAQWISGLREGDRVTRPLADIKDWLCAADGVAYGGFTIDVLRSRMPPEECASHDKAWGLDFGEVGHVRLALQSSPEDEHPFGGPMAEKLGPQLEEDAQPYLSPDSRGLTLLHEMALAGSLAGVKVLIEHGANARERTACGYLPSELAGKLKWEAVSDYLDQHLASTE